MSKYDVYNHQTHKFEAATVQELGFFELGSAAPLQVDSLHALVNMAIYDVPASSIGALRQLGRRLPQCYALVSGSPQALQQIAAADTGVRLIYDAVHAPLGEAGSSLTPEERVVQALGAGAAGALVADVTPELQAHPEAVFFSYYVKDRSATAKGAA